MTNAAVACRYGGRPCSWDVWHGLLSPHTGQHNNPGRCPSLSLAPLLPPHPHHPFMADPFSRSFRGPIKRRAHSVRSEMCNVRKRGRQQGGGGIPRTFTQSRLNWTSHFVEGTSLHLLYPGNHDIDKRTTFVMKVKLVFWGAVCMFLCSSRRL